MDNWYEDSRMVATFARVLNEAEQFASPQDVIYYLEKPWKWSPEHAEWKRLGRLTAADVDTMRDRSQP